MKYLLIATLLFCLSGLKAQDPIEQVYNVPSEKTPSSKKEHLDFNVEDELTYTDNFHIPTQNFESTVSNTLDETDDNKVQISSQTKNEEKDQSNYKAHQLLITGGYSQLFLKYRGSFIGLAHRYELNSWGLETFCCSTFYHGNLNDGIIDRYSLSVTPFIKMMSNPVNIYLGAGLGASRTKFSFFPDYSQDYFIFPSSLPSETYYSLNAVGFIELKYMLNAKYLSYLGVGFRTSYPSYCFYHKGRARNFEPVYPTLSWNLLIGF